jgi:two-component system chemotaxis sensor kinase CheA
MESARERIDAVFKAEARELLGNLEKGLAALGRGGGDDALLRGMARDAHTLRGSATMMGYAAAAAAARVVEESFEAARGGGIPPGGVRLAALRECIERLVQAMDRGAAPPPRRG